MSHQDSKSTLNADCLQKALKLLLGSLDFTSLHFRHDCTWLPLQLVAAALVWAWSDETTLHERFFTARRIIDFIFPPQREFGASYQGFLKLLRKWTAPLIGLLQRHLRERMQTLLGTQWLLHGYAIFAVDGSRINLPRTSSNEKAYGPQRKGRKTKQGWRKRKGVKKGKRKGRGHGNNSGGPQMWLTMLWHMGTGLPWDWRIGPGDSSERGHWMEMLLGLPLNVLFAADAGFVGYDYAKAVLDSGRQLLVRVGSNVRLLKKLGYVRERQGLVYLWPDQAAKKRLPPLVLRLIVIHNGKHPVYLVTSVLAEARLSDQQLAEIYGRRWGIELFYRHLKQTFECRKLRSASADNARVELEWSLAGLWAMGLYAQVILKDGVPPGKISVAGVLRAFRRMLRDYLHPRERGRTLRDLLRRAVIDNYTRRDKTSRSYPRKKQEQPAGPPDIVLATSAQIELAKQVQPEEQKGLPA